MVFVHKLDNVYAKEACEKLGVRYSIRYGLRMKHVPAEYRKKIINDTAREISKQLKNREWFVTQIQPLLRDESIEDELSQLHQNRKRRLV